MKKTKPFTFIAFNRLNLKIDSNPEADELVERLSCLKNTTNTIEIIVAQNVFNKMSVPIIKLEKLTDVSPYMP